MPFLSFGKHLIGGNMSYKCLGNGDYEIELSIYRDCLSDGANFDSEVTFAVYQCDNTIDCSALMQSSQGFSFKVPLTEKKAISPPDPTCVLPQLCVEQGIYRFRFSDFDVFLPNTNNSYHIVYQRCCRNESITNLISPEEVGNTITIAISPEAQQVCNNSPTFEDFPPVIACVNTPFDFSHTAIDEEGDSLVYAFVSPLAGGGLDLSADNYQTCFGVQPTPPCPPPYTSVPFINPLYSATAPFGQESIQITNATGLLSGTPTLSGQFVAAIAVSEYRDGLLLSVSRREFQINMIDCDVENDRIGSTCDDGNPDTEKDRIQEDCSCKGVLKEAIANKVDLFISEYHEGVDSTKCIEIFNPLEEAVDMTDPYQLRLFNTDFPNGQVLYNLIGILPPKATYLICYTASDEEILAIADATFDINFDGDDAISLEKDGALIDLFGSKDCDTGSGWFVPETGNRTINKTLVRCPCVTTGVKLNPTDCEFPTLATEWVCLPVSDKSNLGIHADNLSPTSTIQKIAPFFCACDCRRNDSLALVKLYNAVDGPNWANNWVLTEPMSTWFGVQLNETGCVVCLDLDGIADCAASPNGVGNMLQGALPPEIADLEELQHLFLSHNQLTGNIPKEVSQLKNLQSLWLDDNDFTGVIPPALILIDGLTSLALNQNNLTGAIPIEIGLLPELEQLYLQDNQLSGCFPSTLLSKCSIDYDLSNNPLLPWQGDLDRYCERPIQSNASCDDGNAATTNDVILDDCSCMGGELKDMAADTVILAFQPKDTSIAINSVVCLKVIVQNFVDIVALEYSLNWDSTILRYNNIQNFGLTGIPNINFSSTNRGVLSFSWKNPQGVGVTLENGAMLYEICFTALQEGASIVIFSGEPLPVIIKDGLGEEPVLDSQTATINTSIDDENCSTITNLGSIETPISLTICDDFYQLSTNLPDNFTGTWTANNETVEIENNNTPSTMLTKLPKGRTQLTWTVDTVNCTTYEPNRINLLHLGTPELEQDDVQIPKETTIASFDVIANDNLENNAPYIVQIVSPVNQGILNYQGEGFFEYEPPANYSGSTTFDYQVCYQECREYCEETTVTLSILTSVIEEEIVLPPNAITPNGDGLNDQFIFDALFDNPDKYPNNDFVVFNRWGDQIYRASPYSNEWAGTNQIGEPLPEATYYYILRLDINEGEILKGEVVILR